jgi:hypothetical protein
MIRWVNQLLQTAVRRRLPRSLTFTSLRNACGYMRGGGEVGPNLCLVWQLDSSYLVGASNTEHLVSMLGNKTTDETECC